jgi:DNA-binding NarL/FixJ family response regulator
MPVKVLLYEDNEHLRMSLKALLNYQPDIELMGAMPDAQTVMNDIETLRPNVVLMDIDMPYVSGIRAVELIRNKYPDLPVIMLTIFDDNEHIYKAICAGANGYLLKKNFDQIVPAIKDVLSGGAPMTSSVARQVLTFLPRNASNRQTPNNLLSDRETELLQLLVKGYSYKMIADQLDITLETVRTHIKKIYRKLQVNSATEAAYKAMQEKLL